MTNVKLPDGRIVKLTDGEVNAVRAYLRNNGRTGALQRPPGVMYNTVRNLARKGILVCEAGQSERFADGIFDY